MNSTTTFKKLFISGSIALMAANLSGCGNAQAEADKQQTKEAISIPVEVATTKTGDVSSHYATTAILEAKNEAQVISKVPGILQAIYVEEGDYVEAGQLLAKIEPQRYQLEVNKAKAELLKIKSELAKVEKVHGQNLVSTDTLDKLKWQYESVKSALDLAKLNLKETEIIAPISGFIAQRYVKLGNLVQQYQQQSLFHIVEQKQLQGIVYLPEQQLQHVKVGQDTSLALSALGDTTVAATVERISPIVDAQTGTFKVTLNIPNPKGQLKSGMFAEVSIRYNTHENVLLIPKRAVISMDDKHTVYQVVDGKVSKRLVEVGFQEGAMVEIVNGLDNGSTVVTAGHNNLKDQASVQVIKTI